MCTPSHSRSSVRQIEQAVACVSEWPELRAVTLLVLEDVRPIKARTSIRAEPSRGIYPLLAHLPGANTRSSTCARHDHLDWADNSLVCASCHSQGLLRNVTPVVARAGGAPSEWGGLAGALGCSPNQVPDFGTSRIVAWKLPAARSSSRVRKLRCPSVCGTIVLIGRTSWRGNRLARHRSWRCSVAGEAPCAAGRRHSTWRWATQHQAAP